MWERKCKDIGEVVTCEPAATTLIPTARQLLTKNIGKEAVTCELLQVA